MSKHITTTPPSFLDFRKTLFLKHLEQEALLYVMGGRGARF